MDLRGPAKNRLHDYEAGWLTLLLKMGVASEKALQEAQNRVAQAAIDEMEERRERRRRWPWVKKPPGFGRAAGIAPACGRDPAEGVRLYDPQE